MNLKDKKRFEKEFPDFFDWGQSRSESLPFAKARDFVRSLVFKNAREWEKYCKSGNKPNDIPSCPNVTYKDKGWTSWGDWLNTGTIATNLRKYLSFEDARDFVHDLKLKSQKEWNKYTTSGNKPDNIPSCPNLTYKDKGWINHGDWLGTGFVSTKQRQYISFEEAKKHIHKLHIGKQKEWFLYSKSGKRPKDIPASPHIVYEKWVSWYDWLGTK